MGFLLARAMKPPAEPRCLARDRSLANASAAPGLQPVAERVPQHAGEEPGAAEALATGEGRAGQGGEAVEALRIAADGVGDDLAGERGKRHALAGIAPGDVDAGAEPTDQWQRPERDRDRAAPGVVDARAGELWVEFQEMAADERGRVGRLAPRI